MSDTDTRVAAILRGPTGPQVAAFFDFDGTLIDGYSATAFLCGSGIPLPRLLTAALGDGPVPILRLLTGEPGDADIRFAHAAALRASRGMSEAELADLSERVFSSRLAARLRPEMWSLVQAHRGKGHRVVIITAATRWQVGPLAERLGVDDVLCSTSARLLRGGLKATTVLDFAIRHGIDLAASHAYGDSGDDVPFLELCGNPCAVEPRKALAKEAGDRGWNVLHLDRRAGSAVTLARSIAAWNAALAGLGLGLALDRREAAEFAVTVASRAYLDLAGVRIALQGEKHLRVRPAVFLFNHQSWLDVAVMARLLRRDYTGCAKHELGRVPGLGRLGRALDVVFIDRDEPGTDPLAPMLDLLARGISLAVAPEGTRSATPTPGPFKKGPFLAARKARVPLVPVVIRNSGRLMPRGAKTVCSGHIDVVAYPPIDISTWKTTALDLHIDSLRNLYLHTLMTGRAGAPVGLSG